MNVENYMILHLILLIKYVLIEVDYHNKRNVDIKL